MKPKEVWNLDPEVHEPYKEKYSNWAKNLRNLQKAIQRDRGRMMNDVVAYANDIAIINNRRSSQHNKTPWHLSPASSLLKQHVKKGLDRKMKPQKLYKSRPEYFEHFSLEVFRKHIYQRRYAIPKRAIRFEKKKQKWKYPELHSSMELNGGHDEQNKEDDEDSNDSGSGDGLDIGDSDDNEKHYYDDIDELD